MSYASQKIKDWRRRTKERMVLAMGGVCFTCGTKDQCYEIYDFHHIDPSSKLVSLGNVRANPRGWSRIVIELKKCLLVCSNCHRKIEAKSLILSGEIKSTFDSAFETYISDKSASKYYQRQVYCPMCGDVFAARTKRIKYCSDFCRKRFDRKNRVFDPSRNKVRRTRKVRRPSKDRLIKLLEINTWTAIGKLFGVSDNAVRKWARSYGIVWTPRMYGRKEVTVTTENVNGTVVTKSWYANDPVVKVG